MTGITGIIKAQLVFVTFFNLLYNYSNNFLVERMYEQ